MKVETKHFLDDSYPNGVSRTEKVWELFGIVVKRKVYHYTKTENSDVLYNF